MEIEPLGATGPAGRALAVQLAGVGHDVVIGSRSKCRAMEVRDTILDNWSDQSLSIRSTDNAGAADAEVVVVATPWDAAAATVRSAAGHLHRRVAATQQSIPHRVAVRHRRLRPFHA